MAKPKSETEPYTIPVEFEMKAPTAQAWRAELEAALGTLPNAQFPLLRGLVVNELNAVWRDIGIIDGDIEEDDTREL